MQEVLMAKLYRYILHNNLDLLNMLQQEGQVSSYLEDKVATGDDLLKEFQSANISSYIIEEKCLDFLTKDIRPSRYGYLILVLEEDFEMEYQAFRETGILTYEVINLIEVCSPIFERLGFTYYSENDRHFRYAITGAIKEYLDNNK